MKKDPPRRVRLIQKKDGKNSKINTTKRIKLQHDLFLNNSYDEDDDTSNCALSNETLQNGWNGNAHHGTEVKDHDTFSSSVDVDVVVSPGRVLDCPNGTKTIVVGHCGKFEIHRIMIPVLVSRPKPALVLPPTTKTTTGNLRISKRMENSKSQTTTQSSNSQLLQLQKPIIKKDNSKKQMKQIFDWKWNMQLGLSEWLDEMKRQAFPGYVELTYVKSVTTNGFAEQVGLQPKDILCYPKSNSSTIKNAKNTGSSSNIRNKDDLSDHENNQSIRTRRTRLEQKQLSLSGGSSKSQDLSFPVYDYDYISDANTSSDDGDTDSDGGYGSSINRKQPRQRDGTPWSLLTQGEFEEMVQSSIQNILKSNPMSRNEEDHRRPASKISNNGHHDDSGGKSYSFPLYVARKKLSTTPTLVPPTVATTTLLDVPSNGRKLAQVSKTMNPSSQSNKRRPLEAFVAVRKHQNKILSAVLSPTLALSYVQEELHSIDLQQPRVITPLLRRVATLVQDNFERERDEILNELPHSIVKHFGAIYFTRWDAQKMWLPCLVVSPFSVPPGPIREQWITQYRKCQLGSSKDKFDKMKMIVNWYGGQYNPRGNWYSFKALGSLVPVSDELLRAYDFRSITLQKQLRRGNKKKLIGPEIECCYGRTDLHLDLFKDPIDRRGCILPFDEVHENLTIKDIEEFIKEASGLETRPQVQSTLTTTALETMTTENLPTDINPYHLRGANPIHSTHNCIDNGAQKSKDDKNATYDGERTPNNSLDCNHYDAVNQTPPISERRRYVRILLTKRSLSTMDSNHTNENVVNEYNSNNTKRSEKCPKRVKIIINHRTRTLSPLSTRAKATVSVTPDKKQGSGVPKDTALQATSPEPLLSSPKHHPSPSPELYQTRSRFKANKQPMQYERDDMTRSSLSERAAQEVTMTSIREIPPEVETGIVDDINPNTIAQRDPALYSSIPSYQKYHDDVHNLSTVGDTVIQNYKHLLLVSEHNDQYIQKLLLENKRLRDELESNRSPRFRHDDANDRSMLTPLQSRYRNDEKIKEMHDRIVQLERTVSQLEKDKILLQHQSEQRVSDLQRKTISLKRYVTEHL